MLKTTLLAALFTLAGFTAQAQTPAASAAAKPAASAAAAVPAASAAKPAASGAAAAKPAAAASGAAADPEVKNPMPAFATKSPATATSKPKTSPPSKPWTSASRAADAPPRSNRHPGLVACRQPGASVATARLVRASFFSAMAASKISDACRAGARGGLVFGFLISCPCSCPFCLARYLT